MEKHIHIICLDVPYPVDYGGVFDLYYKLEALHKEGIKIHLHCFEYGRGEQTVLNDVCQAVYYYKRKTGLRGFSFTLPYIVSSRRDNALTKRLLEDDYPILMEGVHCSYLLNDDRFAQRKCFLRLHNVEYIYYRHLFQNTSTPIKKLYYWWETRLLKKYEAKIANKATVVTVNPADNKIYATLGATDVRYLPLFLPDWRVNAKPGKGCYCLYHGNLEVAENEYAARWLYENVFSQLSIPFVIAGKNPSASLRSLEKYENICVVPNPGKNEMQDMIAKAHIHVLPSFNSTGIKLKLLNALYNGRFCVVNAQAIEGTGLEQTCMVANDANAFKESLVSLFEQPFTSEEIEGRDKLLSTWYNNERNAQQLIKWIWED